ncbi:peroxisomal membrane protein PEX14 isoform X1 [Argentina anserina]|uniref:peroxisomal membrane protein PEX14 isoform X1 n=1 Tax=Argentina anserina TaxID=57926 RepID=UPI0021768999|nr:peroxisomal membrane protein PEX14 isoform X1 [Potentilla anserina]XP_050375839.1 peroxisomal membrane protein PEX14 isoform X1 [Potentilla anserina]
MASQSSDGNPQNPVGVAEARQDVAGEPPKQASNPSVFVNTEPMREDQVQNAVKFLSHPKVRGSPVIYRRSFLEKKGLTKEEIDEAFRRVPDPPPSTQATSANQADGQTMTTNTQAQTLQPAATAPASPTARVGTFARYRFHWSHAILAVGLLAASGAGTAVIIKNAIIPRLKSWVRKVVLEDDDDVEKKTDMKPSLAEEAAAAAKSAAAAAADVAKASQEMMNSKTEERKYFGELMSMLDVQVQEMKSMSNSIQKLEGETRASKASLNDPEDSRLTVTRSKQQYVNGKAEYDMQSVQSFAAPASVEPSTAPHSKSYMEIMAMVQRGEKPPNVREIDDLPPNPNQPPSNPRLAPRAKPWELGQTQNNSSQVYQSQTSSEAFSSSMQDNGLNYLNGDSSVPWWQRKTPSITEIENEDEVKAASSQVVRQPVQRAWVPPQPPPVAMPEAAEAIRRPKPSVQKESLGNDQFVARSSSDMTDELQRITKISESGGALEMNNGSTAEISNGNSYLNSTEIHEAQESYE